jgi:hypothetical protein
LSASKAIIRRRAASPNARFAKSMDHRHALDVVALRFGVVVAG